MKPEPAIRRDNRRPASADFPPSASPRRSYLFLAVLALVALGLMLLPRPALYYPHIVIDSPGGIRLDFLLNGRQDKTACRSAANAVASAIGASCRECSTRELACLKNPPAELRGRFDEAPLPVPSARMANGVVTYTAAQAEVALLACRESERQAALRGDQTKVACHPAGAARPHTAFEQQNSQARQSTFTLLLASIGALLAAIVAGIIIAHRHHSALSPQSSSLISHPWLEKLTLAGVDTLILLGTFLAFAWPESDNISRWSRIDRSTVIGHGIVVVLTVGWFWLLLEHYARRRPFWDELRETLRVLVIMAMMSGATAFVAGLEAGRTSHLIVWALNFLLIPLGRAGTRQLLDDLGLWQRSAVIIGTGENARDAWLAIRSERTMGYRLLGFVKVGAGDTAKNAMGTP